MEIKGLEYMYISEKNEFGEMIHRRVDKYTNNETLDEAIKKVRDYE